MTKVRVARATLAALLVAAVGCGCAAGSGGAGVARGSAEPASGRPAPGRPHTVAGAAEIPRGGPAGAAAAYATKLRRAQAARVAVAAKWKLAKVPLVAPPPPAVKPRITTRKGFEVKGGAALPPVFTNVPVKNKVVFLTMDDGADKDPELLRMMSELKIPYSAFLSDYVISDNYAFFKGMQKRGVTLNNHTLHHPYLPSLSYARQHHEICDQQVKITERYGAAPLLFRPPFGNYNRDSLRAAKSCGIKAVPLWEAEAFPDHMEWRGDHKLHPGDIILTHFQGHKEWKASMPDLIRAVMKRITDEGYAVARLEDYV